MDLDVCDCFRFASHTAYRRKKGTAVAAAATKIKIQNKPRKNNSHRIPTTPVVHTVWLNVIERAMWKNAKQLVEKADTNRHNLR